MQQTEQASEEQGSAQEEKSQQATHEEASTPKPVLSETDQKLQAALKAEAAYRAQESLKMPAGLFVKRHY
jgi:hypothetical protein